MKHLRYPVLTAVFYTKRIGFAVADSRGILYFGVKTFHLPRTVKSVKAETSLFFAKIFAEFAIKSAVFKKLGIHQLKSEKEQAVFKHLKNECKARKISVGEISGEQIKTFFFGEQNSVNVTKKMLYEKLTSLYTELKHMTDFQNPFQAEYYHAVLFAVAAAYCLKDIKQQ